MINYSSVNKVELKISSGFISNLNIIDINRIINISREQISKIRYNLAIFKLVSLIGIGAYSAITSSAYKEKEFNITGIETTNFNFNILNNVPYKAVQIGQYVNEIGVNVKNMQEDANNVNTEESEKTKSVDSSVADILVIDEPSHSGMKLSRAYEDKIMELCNEYGVPYQIMLVIGEKESDGKWNNNGVISSTNDYGEFQINECNLPYIEANLGYTKDEILYDPVKNAEACIFLLRDIMVREDVNSLEEIFGMYNGWTNWRKIESSVDYSNGCLEIMDNYFSEYQYGNNKELLKKM